MPKFVKKTYTKDSPADYNYANDLETRIGNAIDPIVDLGISRIVKDSSGWRVVEFADGYTTFEKTVYLPSISFSALATIGYARTINAGMVDGGLTYPYPLKSIVGIDISPNSMSGSGINNSVSIDNIMSSLSFIENIRAFTTDSATRSLRLSILVRGYR